MLLTGTMFASAAAARAPCPPGSDVAILGLVDLPTATLLRGPGSLRTPDPDTHFAQTALLLRTNRIDCCLPLARPNFHSRTNGLVTAADAWRHRACGLLLIGRYVSCGRISTVSSVPGFAWQTSGRGYQYRWGGIPLFPTDPTGTWRSS